MSTVDIVAPHDAADQIADTAGATDAGHQADTYGWDTAFAINFTHANAALVTAWPSVSDKAKHIVQEADDDPSFKIDAVFGPWQLTMGGDGRNIRLSCPLQSGTYHAGTKDVPFDNAGCQVVVEIGMQWVPDPGQFSFVLSSTDVVQTVRADLDRNEIDAPLRSAFEKNGRTLSSSATALAQKPGAEWLVTDGATNYYLFHSTDKFNDEYINVYQFEKAWANNLKALGTSASNDEPAVTIVTVVKNPVTHGAAAAVFEELLSVWFNANIGELNHVFAALDLSPLVASNDKYGWMKPTATSYAVTDQGDLTSSVFGVLTMALNHAPGANHQVSPFAIPVGSDAGFLISGPMFLQNMMLAGAREIFADAPASAFMIDNDGLGVRNTTDLVWGRFMMDEKKAGSIGPSDYPGQLDQTTLPDQLVYDLEGIGVYAHGFTVSVTTAGSQWLLAQGDTEYILNLDGDAIDVFEATIVTIAKGQFTMTLKGQYVEIQFTDLTYSYSSDFDVHVNYTEQVQLTLQDQGNRKIFWFDQIMKNMVVSVTKTKSAITRQIVEGAVMAALSLVAIAGPIIEGLRAGAEVGEVTEEGGEAVITEEAFAEAEGAAPDAAAQDAQTTAGNAAARSGGRLTNIKAAFQTPKWQAMGKIAALAGAVAGIDQVVSSIIEAAAKSEWEKVPAFDQFANLAIAPYTWPNVAGFTLNSAGLAGSLQIGLGVRQP